MPRFVAFLRGVMPTNAKMPELRAAFESAGFIDVKTILGSGNVVFDTPLQSEPEIERRAEQAMEKTLGRSFYTIVRPVLYLRSLIASDPYAANGIPFEAKRVISFTRENQSPKLPLPLAEHDASVFLTSGREVFTAYIPTAKGPVFMALIERAFGTNVTTRTLETVAKCALA
jgi:uncharacterized protein (DUF1697 family)